MQNVSCPSCGAQVEFRSHASVMAVCEYCKTTILKDADSVKDLGKMSDVLEDYSPIQIGTSGTYGSQGFTVIGRIQLRYSAGRWNEWYVMFDDGKTAWLGDSSGLYTLTTERKSSGKLPAFAEVIPSRTYPLGGANYMASELRNADCIGGQGELPFKVGQGYQARVADFRSGASFLTLDYSDSDDPVVYTGQAVTLEELKCQLLRDDDQVKTSAGKFKGKIESLYCPSCGSPIKYLPGITTSLICAACQTQVDASGPKAQVIAAGERLAKVVTTLELGTKAKINGADFELIGVMNRVDEEDTPWTEYLLHNARSGFLWLIETDEGWSRAKVQEKWPDWTEAESVTLGKVSFSKLYEYTATVTFAAGAFNWRVNVGDQTRVVEFESGTTRLAAEITLDEITWSQSTPVAADQIRAWFGEKIAADKAPAAKSNLTTKFIWWILGLNAIPLLASFDSTWIWILLALAAIYLPAKYFEHIESIDKGGKK
jgi:ribosomal protein L37AE/L43A